MIESQDRKKTLTILLLLPKPKRNKSKKGQKRIQTKNFYRHCTLLPSLLFLLYFKNILQEKRGQRCRTSRKETNVKSMSNLCQMYTMCCWYILKKRLAGSRPKKPRPLQIEPQTHFLGYMFVATRSQSVCKILTLMQVPLFCLQKTFCRKKERKDNAVAKNVAKNQM